MEIKSGATVVEDFFKGLNHFAEKLPQRPPVSFLVYGGVERQKRSSVTVLRANDVAEMVGEIC